MDQLISLRLQIVAMLLAPFLPLAIGYLYAAMLWHLAGAHGAAETGAETLVPHLR